MKRLKWLVALAALFVVPIGIEAAPASAANCTASYDSPPIYWTGSFTYKAYLSGCTGVDGVNFVAYNDIPYGGNYTGIYDFSHAAWHFISSGGGQLGGVHAIYWTAYNVPFWGGGCGAAPFLVRPYFGWQIHNSAFGGSWGPWHNTYGPQQWIC